MVQIKIIENHLQEKVIESNSISGGCIANSNALQTESGKKFFIKSLSGKTDMFFKEANGLQELAKSTAIKVPGVILVTDDFLLLEFIEPGLKHTDFFSKFGKQFAQMHAYTSTCFGFYEDNYIGTSPQINSPSGNEKHNWSDFYIQKRLLPQLKMAQQSGAANSKLVNGLNRLIDKVPIILSGSEEPPTLLHGDLWGGNYLCDNSGNPVLIDPATYYGHREADLAMTKMFGGFGSDFYRSYQEASPLPDGWQYRENLYLLYHYLNHLNLFGSSYLHTSIQLINFYL